MAHGSQTELWGMNAWAGPQIETASREVHLVKEKIRDRFSGKKPNLGDVCAGDGDKLSGLFTIANLYAFEIDAEAVDKAKQIYPGIVWIVGDYAAELPRATEVGGRRFDIVTCFGNSLGTLQGDRFQHVRQMAENGDSLFISVFHNTRPKTLLRLHYYARTGIDCSVNWETGTITSKVWGESLAFSEETLRGYGEMLHGFGYSAYEVIEIESIGIALWAVR